MLILENLCENVVKSLVEKYKGKILQLIQNMRHFFGKLQKYARTLMKKMALEVFFFDIYYEHVKAKAVTIHVMQIK